MSKENTSHYYTFMRILILIFDGRNKSLFSLHFFSYVHEYLNLHKYHHSNYDFLSFLSLGPYKFLYGTSILSTVLLNQIEIIICIIFPCSINYHVSINHINIILLF